MPEVYAIEAANCDGGSSMMGLQSLYSTDEFHDGQALALRMWRMRSPQTNKAAK